MGVVVGHGHEEAGGLPGIEVGRGLAGGLEGRDRLGDPLGGPGAAGKVDLARLVVDRGELLEQRVQLGVTPVLLEEPAVRGRDGGCGVVGRERARGAAHVDLVERVGDDGTERVDLGGEVTVEGAHPDLGRRGDVDDSGVVEAVALEHELGRGDELGTRLNVAFGGATAAGVMPGGECGLVLHECVGTLAVRLRPRPGLARDRAMIVESRFPVEWRPTRGTRMDAQPTLEEFRAEARAWLTTVATPRSSGTQVWGEGELSVVVFDNWTDEEEATVVAAGRAWEHRRFAAGFGAISWSTTYGGRALPQRYAEAYVAEEEGFVTPRRNELFEVTRLMMAPTVDTWGTAEQKERFVVAFLRTDLLCCQLFSEPGAGSDLAGVATRADRDGDGWVLNGQKVWTSGARSAEWGLAICRTDTTVAKHAGMTAFFVPLDAPGVTVRPIKQMSQGASFNEVFFDDVHLSDELRLGPEGAGWKVALTTLSAERAASSSLGGGSFDQVLGLARAMDATADPVHRQALADLYIHGKVDEWNVARVTHSLEAGDAPGPEGSIGRLSATRNLTRAAHVAARLLGRGSPPTRASGARTCGTTTCSALPAIASPAVPTRSSTTSSASACSVCRASRADVARPRRSTLSPDPASAFVDAAEEPVDDDRVDLGQRGRLPPGGAVLVDERGTDALVEIRRVEELHHHRVLEGQARLERGERSGAAQRSERDHEGERRARGHHVGGGVGALGGVRPQALDDGAHVVGGVARVDPVAVGHQLARIGGRHDARQRHVVGGFTGAEAGDHRVHRRRGDASIGEPESDRVVGREVVAGEAGVGAQLARRPRQQPRATDVGHEPDADLGHADASSLGDPAVGGVCGETHAAAEHDAVHQGDHRLGAGGDARVQRVLLGEEPGRGRIAGLRAQAGRHHVATGRESPLAGTTQDDGADRVVALEFVEPCESSRTIGRVSALIAFGRFSVSTPAAPRRSTSTSPMGCSGCVTWSSSRSVGGQPPMLPFRAESGFSLDWDREVRP